MPQLKRERSHLIGAPSQKKYWIIAASLVSICVGQWLLLFFGIRFEKIFGFWFWYHTSKPMGTITLNMALLIAAVLVAQVVKTRCSSWLKLSILVIFGVVTQIGFGFTEGRGMAAIEDRMVKSGHARFAIDAVRIEDTSFVLHNFETLLDQDKLNPFAKSKPPGQVLLYVATERTADFLFPQSSAEDRFYCLVRFSSYVWSFISCLTILPLFFWVRRIWGETCGYNAALLYLVFPAVNLINLHTDQVFFPLLFMLCLLTADWAARRRLPAAAIVPGVVVYSAMFFSFALAAAIPFVLWTFWVRYKNDTDPPKRLLAKMKQFALRVTAAVAGSVTMGVAFFIGLNYRIFERFDHAMIHHGGWKSFLDIDGNQWLLGLLNIFEFVYWAGLGVTSLLIITVVRAVVRRKRDKSDFPIQSLMVLFIIVMVYLAFCTHTIGETARLWIFLLPLTALFVAHALQTSLKGLSLTLLVCLQLLTTYCFKIFQDFY
jgi:hypothetical protein